MNVEGRNIGGRGGWKNLKMEAQQQTYPGWCWQTQKPYPHCDPFANVTDFNINKQRGITTVVLFFTRVAKFMHLEIIQ